MKDRALDDAIAGRYENDMDSFLNTTEERPQADTVVQQIPMIFPVFGPVQECLMEIVTLIRPTRTKELELKRASGFEKWPPRLPEQPIFYPVTSEKYAARIARDWNARDNGASYVTHFQIHKVFMDR